MQKTILFILTIIIFSNTANCQIDKRFWMIGGAASFTSTKYESTAVPGTNRTLIQLSGDVGYFFFDKLAAGLKPGFENSGVKFFSGLNTSNILEIGPFARYYFLPKEKIVNILAEASYQFGTVWSTTNETLHNNKFSLSGGLSVFFNESVGLELTVGYSTIKYTKSTGLNKSIISGIGFQFYLQRKEH